MAIKIVAGPTKPFQAHCKRCSIKFTYELVDLHKNYVRGGEWVSCPGCGESHRHPDQRLASLRE